MLLKKREKIILYLTAAFGLFALMLNFVILPALNKNAELDKGINYSRIKLAKYRLLAAQKTSLMSKYNKFNSSANLNEATADPLVSALSELEAVANQSNIRIIDIRPQASKNIDIYKEVLIELRTEGNIDGYVKFIYNIENSFALLRITRFRLTAMPNSTGLDGDFSVSKLITSD
jgi:hypothetical protein